MFDNMGAKISSATSFLDLYDLSIPCLVGYDPGDF